MLQKARTGYPHGEGTYGEVLDEYIYLDEHGRNYLKVERRENKQFPCYHWVPGNHLNKHGYWKPGKPKGPHKPYFLPQLIKAPADQIVWVAEGEKDTETLIDNKLIATSNPFGAGKWTADLNQWFKGKQRAVILEDNDNQGRNHARRVALNLFDIVEDVRILRLPGLPEHEDVTWWFEHGGTMKELLRLADEAPRYTGQIQLQVYSGQIERGGTDMLNVVRNAKHPLLQRGIGLLVEPIWIEQNRAPPATGKTKSLVFVRVTPAKFVDILTKYCTCVQYNPRAKELVPISPPDKMVKALLDRAHWDVPKVSGAINAPTMRLDGSIFDEPGYDATTQLWLELDRDFSMPPIAAEPTRAEAEQALKLLKDLISGFHWVNNVDTAVALAAILTAVLRGAFAVAPMLFIGATKARSGKSFFVDLVSHIATGHAAPVIALSEDTEEAEKQIGALLLEGLPIISLDNMKKDFDSPLLNQMTTQTVVKARILGTSDAPNCEWRGTLFGTGNNVLPKGDMIYRTLVANIDAQVPHPELLPRAFNPIERVMQDRGAYVAAALTMARAYLVADVRSNRPPLAGFDQWCSFVREPLLWLGEEDPVKSQDAVSEEDTEQAANRELIEHLIQIYGTGQDKSFKVNDVIKCARETKQNDVMAVGVPDWVRVYPELHDLLNVRARRGNDLDAQRAGSWFKELRGQVFDIGEKQYRLVRVKHDDKRGSTWAVEVLAAPKA
jgi:hypothetical protein